MGAKHIQSERAQSLFGNLMQSRLIASITSFESYLFTMIFSDFLLIFALIISK